MTGHETRDPRRRRVRRRADRGVRDPLGAGEAAAPRPRMDCSPERRDARGHRAGGASCLDRRQPPRRGAGALGAGGERLSIPDARPVLVLRRRRRRGPRDRRGQRRGDPTHPQLPRRRGASLRRASSDVLSDPGSQQQHVRRRVAPRLRDPRRAPVDRHRPRLPRADRRRRHRVRHRRAARVVVGRRAHRPTRRRGGSRDRPRARPPRVAARHHRAREPGTDRGRSRRPRHAWRQAELDLRRAVLRERARP